MAGVDSKIQMLRLPSTYLVKESVPGILQLLSYIGTNQSAAPAPYTRVCSLVQLEPVRYGYVRFRTLVTVLLKMGSIKVQDTAPSNQVFNIIAVSPSGESLHRFKTVAQFLKTSCTYNAMKIHHSLY